MLTLLPQILLISVVVSGYVHSRTILLAPLLKLDISLDFSVRMTVINKFMLFWKQVYYGDNVQQVEFGIWYCYKQFKQKRQKMTRTKLLAP